MRYPSRLILPGLILIVAALSLAMPVPPPAAVRHHQGKTIYYSGMVYLSSHDDTVRLKELGFRDFEFECRSFHSLKYKAKWPDSAVDVPIPDYVTGMNYDVTIPDRELIVGYYEDPYPSTGYYTSDGTYAYPDFGHHREPASLPRFSTGSFGGSCVSRHG